MSAKWCITVGMLNLGLLLDVAMSGAAADGIGGMRGMNDRPRARDTGVVVGTLPTGHYNAITDVAGVKVGHITLMTGKDVRTGVTAILPHGENVFREKVPAAVHVGNGFGKLIGSTQIDELGNIETPILLTNTLNVGLVADGVVQYMLSLPGNETVRSINPVVGETNDGELNDIRGRHVRQEHVRQALESAAGGAVPEGSVGAGTGTRCFGFKGGIGTSSRVVAGYTVGVLVQANYGGSLTINGAPVGRELAVGGPGADSGAGSCMIVVATDAPLLSRNLKRLASRAMLGLGRTGSYCGNGSGEYVIAFCTAEDLRIRAGRDTVAARELDNSMMSPLFHAVIEATEEAAYNALFRATTVTGKGGRTVEAIPIARVVAICRKHNVLTEGDR